MPSGESVGSGFESPAAHLFDLTTAVDCGGLIFG